MGQWQALQSRYLDPTCREGLRQILETPGALPPEPISTPKSSARKPSADKAKPARRRTRKSAPTKQPASEA
ncbi:MAG: hypothetical protein HC812_02655 [Leptolyngbya sp. RL_3_1]|nr:hypothetical protein [Leptolyngbya sp. RL_3_1]